MAAAALESLAAWLRGRYAGRARARRRPSRRAWRRRATRRPCVVTPEVHRRPAGAGSVGAAPSALQPGGHRGGRRALARRAAGGVLRHQLSSRPAGGGRTRAVAARDLPTTGVQRYGFHGLSYEYIASVLPRGGARDRRRARDRRPPGQRRQPLRAEAAARASTARWASPRSTGCAWARGRAPIDPGVVLHLFQSLGLSAKEVETILYKKSGLLGHFGHQQRHARPAREPRAGGAPGGRLLRLPGGQGDRRPGRRPAAVSTHWSSPPASARTPRRFAAASARPRPGWVSISIRAPTARRPADLQGRQPRVGLGDSDQRRTDDCPAHRALAGIDRTAREA